MTSAPAIASVAGAAALLSTLTETGLAAADRCYPKWATMCQLRRIGLPVLDAVLLTPGKDHQAIEAAINALTAATGQERLMVRSDGGGEFTAHARALVRADRRCAARCAHRAAAVGSRR